jgi:hypothetical protein
MEIKLGQTVEDAVSGFRGIAHQMRQTLNGNVQFAVQPKVKEGEVALPDSVYFDRHMLNVIDDGVSGRVTATTHVDIPLGTRVRDVATGLEGIATARHTFINGCVFYDVMPKKKTEMFDANPDAQFIDSVRLEIVRSQPKVPLQIPQTRTGGPSGKVKREAVRR